MTPTTLDVLLLTADASGEPPQAWIARRIEFSYAERSKGDGLIYLTDALPLTREELTGGEDRRSVDAGKVFELYSGRRHQRHKGRARIRTARMEVCYLRVSPPIKQGDEVQIVDLSPD